MNRKTENLYRAVLFSIHELLPNFVPSFAIEILDQLKEMLLKNCFPQ